jgi:hypothetical protein
VRIKANGSEGKGDKGHFLRHVLRAMKDKRLSNAREKSKIRSTREGESCRITNPKEQTSLREKVWDCKGYPIKVLLKRVWVIG